MVQWSRAVGHMVLLGSMLGLPLGCASAQSSATDIAAAELNAANGWTLVSDVPFERQHDDAGNGPAALAMVLRHYGLGVRQDEIRESKGEDDPSRLRDFARSQGLNAFVLEGDLEILVHELQQNRPVIVGLGGASSGGAHYEVVVGFNVAHAELASLDPAQGYRRTSFEGFLAAWKTAELMMIAVLPPPGDDQDEPDLTPHSPAPTQAASVRW